MQSKKKWLGVLILATLVAIPLSVTAQGKSPLQEKSQKSKEPIEITSDRMRSENGGVKIIFSGNVEGFRGDLKITSDIMEVYNSEDKKETDEIVAIGNVVITRGLKKATGDKAVYLDKLQKIILTGTPKATAWEEDNMIEGREMIFLLEKDRFIVNERVRMKLYPKDEEDKKKKTQSKQTQKDQLSSSKNK